MPETSDLHKKILANMDSETKKIEAELESMKVPRIPKKETGFFAKIKKLLFK